MSLPGHIRRLLIHGSELDNRVMLILEYIPKDPSGQQWRFEYSMTGLQWVQRTPEVEQQVYDMMVNQLSEDAEAFGISEPALVRMLELAGL
jgi:hypothetical protein